MRKIALTVATVSALVSTGSLTPEATADEAPVVRHSNKLRHICRGPHCGPYAPCGVRCRVVCPDRYYFIRCTGPTGLMAEAHSGERTPIRGGVIAEK